MTALPVLGRLAWVGNRAESLVAAAAILAMAVLPVAEMLLRPFGVGMPGSQDFVQHMTLWVAFVGAMIATREKRHLSLSTGLNILPPRVARYGDLLVAMASATVSTGLFWASLQFTLTEYRFPLGGQGLWVPAWLLISVMPLAFAVITVRFVLQAGGGVMRIAALAGIPVAFLLGELLVPAVPQLALLLVAVLILAAIMGAPIFIVIGGAALVLFVGEGVPVAAVPVEPYRIVVSSAIPAIPLFTLTGYLLAEGKAGERLVRLFRALFGWMPGGMPIATTLVCAFFTTFTGASGATILALGGLLLPVLVLNKYSERFSLGLLTATGSIGLLFPPSLAVILYAVVAKVSIPDMFVAGIVPGALMVGAVCIYGIVRGRIDRTPRIAFERREALDAVWRAKYEIALPLVVLYSMFGGWATLIEAAAITVVYALVVGVFIHRDLDIRRNLPDGLMKCV
ncbi:MAG: TRAP transporter large permease subunit, partial [Alphaproteobacteria bacterium]